MGIAERLRNLGPLRLADYGDADVDLPAEAADEIERLKSALEDLIGLAEFAMRLANRDGAEFDIKEDLADARAALRSKEGK